MFKYILICLILFILLFFGQQTNAISSGSSIISLNKKTGVINNSWEYYKKTFISDDGRVIDRRRGSVTTSEGQAYAMQRALLLRDKAVFDKTYNWSKYNLQHSYDKLFAWLWGPKKSIIKRGKVKYKILDQNCASDADIEIAFCLILAHKCWNQRDYIEDAKKILDDIWDKETIEVHGERVLASGCKQKRLTDVEINPSYFIPYAFRTFVKVDKKHDWQRLVDSSYRLTIWCMDNIKSGLPPDIFYINRSTGLITFDKDKSDFSYDAIRVFYMFYVDYAFTRDPRAIKILSRSKLFIDRWRHDEKFYTQYKQNGKSKDKDESIGSIAIMLPIIKIYNKEVAEEIYEKRIKAKYDSDGFWEDSMDYYAQNLVWFGDWLYLNEKNIELYKF